MLREKFHLFRTLCKKKLRLIFLVSDVIIQYSCSDQFIALRVGRNRVPNSAIFQLQYQKRGNYEEIHANESLEVYIYINNFLLTKLLQFDKTDLWSVPITFHFRFDIGDVRDQDFLISRKRIIMIGLFPYLYFYKASPEYTFISINRGKY